MRVQSCMVATLLAATLSAGCHNYGAPVSLPKREPGGTFVQDNRPNAAWSFFGPASANNFAIACAGRVTLAQGSATIKDSCFTGDTNVVVCTDASAAMPVMCAADKGALRIAGSASDVVSYARVR
jgi:hypothetical protein